MEIASLIKWDGSILTRSRESEIKKSETRSEIRESADVREGATGRYFGMI